MRSIVELLIALALVALFFLGLAYFLPQNGHVERSIVIERPASHVFDTVNGFARFDQWSPWHKKAPTMTTEISGPPTGFGAAYRWSATDEAVSAGDQRIIEADPYRLVKISHNWERFAPATVTFKFKPTDLGVQTTWSYDIDLGMNPVMRYRGMYLDGAIGEDFQMGLMRLKALLESTPYARDYSDIDVRMVDLLASPALQSTGSVTVYTTDTVPDVPLAIDEAVAKLNEYAAKNKINVTGRPIINMLSRDRYSASFDIYLPVSSTEGLNPPKEIKLSQTFAGKFVTAEHWGRRNLTNVTAEKLQAYLSVHGMKPVSRPFEELLGEMAIVEDKDEDEGQGDPAAEGAGDGEINQNVSAADSGDENPDTEFVTNIYFMLEPPVGETVPPALVIPQKGKPASAEDAAGPAPPADAAPAEGGAG